MVEALSLRARKKLAAMHRIQTVALELFEAHGFDAVTIEQIADASEVSASSIYRYFGSKEMLVVWDEYDDAGLDAAVDILSGADPFGALKQILTTAMEQAVALDRDRIEQRVQMVFTHPSIEATAMLHAYRTAQQMATRLGQARGRPGDDLQLAIFAHAMVGGFLGALRHWHDTGFAMAPATLAERVLDPLKSHLGFLA